jgi:outer membrane immunogenic protein
MRSVLLSSLAIVAFAGAAVAADLPSSKSAPAYYAPAPVFTWTGFYVGVEGGADFLSTKGLGFGSSQTAGLIGGVVGYNYQINQFVVGLEANGGGVLGGGQTSVNATAFNPYGLTRSNNGYYADVRGRVGYAYDRALFYAAGGVAFGDVRTTYSNALIAAPIGVNSNRTGYTIGAGVDYAFTPNWIGRVEYRYTDLGRNTYNAVYDRVRNDSSAVLVGLIYKFGSSSPELPALAKY